MKRHLLALCCLSVFAASEAGAQVNPAYEYSFAGTGVDARDFSLGFQFALSDAKTVDALGYSAISLTQAEQVGIWDSLGNLLTSATVLTTDPVTGHFAWHGISAITLSAGTYTIGGTYLGGTLAPVPVSGAVDAPGFTWLADEQLQTSALAMPTVSTGGYGDHAFALVNLSFAGSAAPEPASWAMMLGGFGMIGGAMRARRRTAVSFG